MVGAIGREAVSCTHVGAVWLGARVAVVPAVPLALEDVVVHILLPAARGEMQRSVATSMMTSRLKYSTSRVTPRSPSR